MSTSLIDRLSAALAGRYHIERELGSGGMATIYLAEDIKHDRKVAVKVLKPELAAVLGAERFVVEIKTTASLQHPHILPLFDSGTADGFLFYVMPYIQGETIREKLNRETQFGVDESVRIAREVADALDYAHRHGVIHRDIKPENVLLHDGRAMVMDFGIALALSAAAGGRMTETGLSLGTPHYMSPEQATADKDLTPRSDVYSLASVLYEMLTGSPPHVGGSAQQIIMRIITDTARPVNDLRKSVPPNVAAALARALEKLPADRFESAKAFADALGNAAFARPEPGGASGRAASGAGVSRLTVGLGVAAVIAVAAALWGWFRPAPPEQVLRLPITLPADAALQQQPGTIIALSRDGSELVYVGPGGNDIDLFLRPMNSLTATRVPGTHGADSPFLSRDGSVVAFYRGTPPELYTVSLRGGPRQTLASDSTFSVGGSFGPDGFIYFVRRGGLRRVPQGGGAIELVSRVDTARGETLHAWPDALPNGKGLIFTIVRAGGEEQNDIAALDIKSGRIKVLFHGLYARYTRGHLLFVDAAGGLFAFAFDEGSLTTSGGPIPIVAGVTHRENGVSDFAVSENGTLLYGTGGAVTHWETVWVDRAGHTESIDSTLTGAAEVALSPDGHRLALTQVSGSRVSVWTKELDHGPVGKLTMQGEDFSPVWSPDGRDVIFTRARGEAAGALFSRRADGSGNATLLLHPGRAIKYGFVSGDGKWIVYQTTNAGASTGRDIFARRVDGDTTTVVVAATAAEEVGPRLSPDGHWLAYVSAESGTPEVFVVPFPNTASGRTQVSVAGGLGPVWARNGRELFYVGATDRKLTAARVATSPVFRVEDRVPLFDADLFHTPGISRGPVYDVSLDGRRFLMSRPLTATSEQLVLVQHWSAELGAGGKK